MDEKITAILMLEILGRPPEHIKATLSEMIDKMGKEKDVKVVNRQIAEAKPVAGQENLFTSFAEIEIETDLRQLILLVLGYLPSHIDIITPENLRLRNADLNMFLNELTRRLHQYDELAKAILIEREILSKQIQEGKIKIVNEPQGKIKEIVKKKVEKKAKKKN
jgi:hypothetical protein